MEITVVWNDEWLTEVRIVAANGPFQGGCQVYANPDWLLDLAKKFRGYPKTREDHFRVVLGEAGLARVTIEAFGVDASGHVALAVRTIEEPSLSLKEDRPQQAEIVFAFEPAAADRFADELETQARTVEGSANLRGVPGFQ
ncbi:MAG: hypothetical protein ABFS30_00320 [Pseudomonadota bacterium]